MSKVPQLQQLMLSVIREDIIDALVTGNDEILVIHANGDEFIACYNECLENRPEVSVNFIIASYEDIKDRITDISLFDPVYSDVFIEDVAI